MASAAFKFNSQSPLVKFSGASAGTVTATLDSLDGVRTVLWAQASKDESAGDVSFSSTTATSTTITLPAATGKAFLIRCTVNGGTEADPRTGLQRAGDLIKTAKIYVGQEVLAVGETTESDSTYGYCVVVNPALRAATVSGSNAVITALAGGYISMVEGTTEVARVFDDGGVRSLTFQGAAEAEIETSQGLSLRFTGNLGIFDAGVECARLTDATNKSVITLPGSAGGRIQAPAGSQVFELQTGTGSVIKLQHDVNDTFYCTLASSVSTWDGRGSSGTTVSANAGPLRMQCASGSEVRLGEGATDVAYLRDDAGIAELKLKGASASRITSDNALVIQPTSTYYTSINDGSGTELVTFASNYMRFPTNTPTGTVPAGYAALGFNGTNLILRIGTTNYTIQKV